jgi:hypothetical protein
MVDRLVTGGGARRINSSTSALGASCVRKVNSSNSSNVRFDGCIEAHMDIEGRFGIRREHNHIHGTEHHADFSCKSRLRRIESQARYVRND